MERITINGTIAQFSAKINVPVALWEVKGGRAKGKSLEADRINRHLDNIRGQINRHYQFICDRETHVTAEKVRNAFMGFDKRSKPCWRPSMPTLLAGAADWRRSFEIGVVELPCRRKTSPLVLEE